MRKHFIIDLLCAGAIASVLLVGCGKAKTQYCTAGMNLLESNDYDGAIAEFNDAISKNANNRDAYRGLGIAYYRMDNIQGAMEQFKKVIDMSGNKYDDIALDALKYYAECLYNSGDYENAINEYGILINKCSKKEQGDLYFLRGCAYIHMNDENNAALDFEKAIELKGSDNIIYCNMYNEFMKAGLVDRAESYLKRLINSNASDDFMIGKTYYAFGEYERAEEYFERAVDKGNSDATYYLAMTYEAEDRLAEAEEIYLGCIKKDSKDANVYNQYAAYLINRKDYESAFNYIEDGLKYAKGDAKKALTYNKGVCYEYMFEYKKAYEIFDEYVKEYPNDEKAMREYVFLKSRV